MNDLTRRQAGFTLVELMIVLAIVAILAAIAIPSYQSQIRKTHRKDAMSALQGLAQSMERFYAQNNTYIGAAGSKASPGDSGAPWVFPATSPIDGGAARYNLTIVSSTANDYVLSAQPTGAQADDGELRLDSTGLRRWDKDNDGSFSASERTWNDH